MRQQSPHRPLILRELMAGGTPKTIAISCGLCAQHVSNLVSKLGFRQMYLSSEERASIRLSRNMENKLQQTKDLIAFLEAQRPRLSPAAQRGADKLLVELREELNALGKKKPTT